MTKRTVLLVLAALLGLPVAQSADVDTMGVVAVAPPPGPGTELVEMTGQLRLVLSERSPGVLDAEALRDRMTGPSRGASLGELDKAYEGALAAYLNGDYEGSVRTLRAVVEDLEKLPDDAETFRQWTRAMMRLTSTELDLGRRDEAQDAANKLVRADPGVKVDAVQYPPELVRLIDSARSELRSSLTQALTVKSSTTGVRVFVNGRDIGMTPLTVKLARGRYRISGVQGTVRAPPMQVDFTDQDQSVTLDFSVSEALRPNLGPGLALGDAERARRLIAAGGFLRLDSILATSLLDDAGASYLLGSLYDVRRGMLMREGRVRLSERSLPRDGAARLADFFVTGKATAPVEPYPPLGAPPPARIAEKSKGLGWTAFGAGIATVGLAGVSVWQAVSSNSSYNSAQQLVLPNGTVLAQNQAAYNNYLSQGDSAHKTAIITGVGAGVCAVTTVVLGYLSYKQTGLVGPFRF